MTPAMQKVVLWYLFGVAVVVVYGSFRLKDIGGVRVAIRDPKLLRELGLFTLAVLAAPVVLVVVGILLFLLFVGDIR